DIDGFLRIPRLAAIAAGPEGRVVAAIQEADENGAKLVSSLWELDPEGRSPARRLTFSEQGESAPRFAPDGSLPFSSARPDPEGGSALAATRGLAGGTLEDDAERRTDRKDAGRTDIWHTGMPIRLWDHEIGDQSRRLVLVSPEGELTDLAPDAGPVSLLTASA